MYHEQKFCERDLSMELQGNEVGRQPYHADMKAVGSGVKSKVDPMTFTNRTETS